MLIPPILQICPLKWAVFVGFSQTGLQKNILFLKNLTYVRSSALNGEAAEEKCTMHPHLKSGGAPTILPKTDIFGFLVGLPPLLR